MKRAFTGRDMAILLGAGFGVVFAVNMFMAAIATNGFGGVVVENSYVASQKYNGWLEEARQSAALGWGADWRRTDQQHLLVTTTGVPASAHLTAELRRPLGAAQFEDLTFSPAPDGSYLSNEPVAPGRWIVRLKIAVDGDNWAKEKELL